MNDKTSTKAGTCIMKINRVSVDIKPHAHKSPDRLIQINLCGSLSAVLGSPKYPRSGWRCRWGTWRTVQRWKSLAMWFSILFIHQITVPGTLPTTAATLDPKALQLRSSWVPGLLVPYGERRRDHQLIQTRSALWGLTPGGGVNHSTEYH